MRRLHFAADVQPFIAEHPLTLASDLRAPLGHARLLCRPDDPDPEHGVWVQLEAALVSRPASVLEATVHPPAGRVLVSPGLLVRPLLYFPVRVAELRALWAQAGEGEELMAGLGDVLYPRPAGHPPRVPIRLSAPWTPPVLPDPPDGVELANYLREHPGEVERRRFGGQPVWSAAARDRARRIAHPRCAVERAQPMSLAHALVLLCPHQRADRRLASRLPGTPSVAGRLIADLLGGERPNSPYGPLLQRANPWSVPAELDEALVGLRKEAVRALRSLTPRSDLRRLRQVQASLLGDHELAARPIDAALLWRAGDEGPSGGPEALAATAELLRDGLRGADWASLSALATGGELERLRLPEGSLSGLCAALQLATFHVAQVVVPPSHPLFLRARGAAALPDPRRAGGFDYHQTWGDPAARLQSDLEEGALDAVLTFAGVGASAKAMVERWLGPGDWPVVEPVRFVPDFGAEDG
jgi:hypothetical protein